MKKIIFALFLAILTLTAGSQNINGVMVLDTNNFHVIKVWGTAQERAYAYGYLLGDIAAQLFNNFLKPGLGNQYQEARDIIINGVDITIDSVYIQEAIAFVEGYHASTTNPLPADYVDVLIGNAWEEVVDLLNNKGKFHCSSLMSWGDATAGTNLDGKSVITSHLDSYPTTTLLASHVIVVHFPSEPNSQPWLAANVAGIMTPKYGCNRYNNIVNHIGDGTMIGIEENWNLMKNYSLQYINFQVKQYAPEADLLKMAVMSQVNIPAANTEPYLFSLDELFTQPNPVGTEHHYQIEEIKYPDLTVIPNPLSSSATIEYHLKENEKVSLVLFNHLGQEIQIIVNAYQAKGRNSVRWDATGLPAGIYF